MTDPTTSQPDQAALRDRIAEALYERDHPHHVVPLTGTGMVAAYRESADAVLAVLPAPTDRAAVLREAAEVAVREARGCGDSEAGQYAASVAAGIAKILRRMADETQPSGPPADDDAEAEAERQMATVQRVRHVLDTEHVVGRTALEYRGLVLAAVMADEQPAAEAQQDGERKTS